MAETNGKSAERFATLAKWMLDHLSDDLSVETLAERTMMSPRNFARRFPEAMGASPGLYVRRLRVDTARRLLTDTDFPIGEIAARCGFGTAETMRLAFQRQLSVAPQQFRNRFRRPAPLANRADILASSAV